MKKTLFLSAILGAALCSNAFAETTYNGVTYSGHILNIDTTDSATFHNRNFSDFYQNEGGTWVNGKEFSGAQNTYYYGADTTGTNAGTNTWNYFFGNGNGKYSTLRLTGATKDIYLDAQFTPLTLGGMIAEAGDYTYTIGRKDGGCGIVIHAEDGQQANLTINSNVRLSAGTVANKADQNNIKVESNGTWDIAQGKSLTLAHFDTNNNETPAAGGIYVNAAVTLTGQGTLKLNGASVNLGNNASLSVSGNSHLALCSTMVLGSGASLNLADGATLVADNMVHGDVTFAGLESGLQTGSITYTLASGSGSVTRTGVQKVSLAGGVSTIETWAADSKSFDTSTLYYRIAQGGTVTVGDVNSAISGSADSVAGIWVDGTLTNVTNSAAPAKAVLGNGVVKITGDYGKGTDSQLGEFNGTIHITGASARTLFYTGNSIGINAEVELGVRGQIVSDNGKTFTNAITIGDFSESGIGDSLLPTIYANSRTESTINSTFNLNGHTLFKQGAGTLNVTSKAAVSSLLGSGVANNGKLVIDGGGTLRLGADSSNDFGDNYGTSIEVRNGTLDLRTENRDNKTKTFNGDLTMKNGTLLSLYDGGAKFAGNVNLVSGTINMNSNWGKMGIELAGLVSGSANVYMTDGANNRTETYTISHADNTFSGTYFVGKNSNGTVAGSKVTLKAANATALKDATVDLTGGDKAALLLTTTTATVATLNGVAGSTVTTTAEATELTVGAGTFAGVISEAIAINKTGTGTLTLNGNNTYTGGTTVTGGTLKMGNASAIGATGAVVVKDGAVLDATGVYLANNAAGNWNGLKTLNDRTTTSGTGYINLGSGEITMQTASAITLSNAYQSTGMTINGQNYQASIASQSMTVGENGSLKVTNADHNAVLSLVSGAIMNIDGGSVTADSLSLGHGDGASNDGTKQYFAQVALAGGSLTTGSITLSTSIGNALSVTGGTLTVTSDKLFASDTEGALATLSLTGGTLAATDNSWTINRAGTIGGVTISTGTDKSITIGANVTISGAITNNGNLVFADGISATAAAGTFAVTDNSGSLSHGTSGFVATTDRSITVVNNGAGASLTANNATITQGDESFTLGNDGVAVNKTVDYTTYKLNGTDNASVSDMKTESSNQVTTVDMNSTGTLTVDADITNVSASGTNAVVAIDGGAITNLTVMENADLTVTSAAAVALNTLTMESGSTVTVNNHEGTLALQNLTVGAVEEGQKTTINANLEISGGTMTMGSSVEMGCGITLSNENLVLTNGVVEDGVLQMYTLFTDVESLTLGSGSPVEMGWYDASTVINSITIGTGATAITIDPANCVIGYWNGTVTISDKSVPEPATATLSLLALAGLCARRRRK